MCFSAAASFSAAAVCGVIGAAALRRARKPDLMLAAIPLIFGAHQALEGAVWLTEAEGWGRCAGYGFAGIAFCFWPVYTPLAAWLSEPDGSRRSWMLPFLVLGVAVAILAASVLYAGLKIDFAAHHIKYVPGRRYPLIFDYLYAAAVVGPLLLSRSIFLRIFGGLILAFFGVSTTLFNPARYSVWCFFAAISSAVLYFFIVSRNASATVQPDSPPARDGIASGLNP